jgi:tetratricopeptide (TPR) repeat protein
MQNTITTPPRKVTKKTAPEPEKKIIPEAVSAQQEKKKGDPQASSSKDISQEPSRKISTPQGNRTPQKSVNISPSAVHVPIKRVQSEYKGDISDLIRTIDGFQCTTPAIDHAMLLLKKAAYKAAFEGLAQYVSQENAPCLEPAYFLKAYAFYNTVRANEFALLIKAERLFQDALVSFPESSLRPYGYAAIGLIQKKMNNISAAEGYFNIVKQDYPAYSGHVEILYHLADIYARKGYSNKALRYYRQVFEDPAQNAYIPDAGIGYGRVLFDNRQYRDALTVLNSVVASHPKKVYASHELLLQIGNANFEVGQSKAARQALNRVLNLFPEIENRDIILNKIGDTYGMENNHEKAMKIYELVREKFPGSEGYIAASIGIARYLKKDQEKIDIYEMIKNRFPENKFARIAMMRLAEIYQAKGEYHNCIKEIEDLLSTHPRGLQYEAVKLMQSAYEALFERQLKSDDYTQVLNRYELEHERIDRMGSGKIALSVGLAYLQAKLYEESFNHLIMAYKQSKKASRSVELLLGLGIAMDESGRDDDALKLFDAVSKRFPRDARQVEALCRAGGIYYEKKKYALSSETFNTAYKVSKRPLEKGNILTLHSTVYEEKGDMVTASDLRERAIKEIALASGENYEVLTSAYKELGRTYTSLKKYIKSADAYLKALRFSTTDREKATLGFLLGDAYQKGNSISEAKKAFKQVVTSYDSVWARLAQQRLNTFELAQMVENS